MFLMESWLERKLYFQIRNKYKGKIVPQYPLGKIEEYTYPTKANSN
jgi:hypothetical protein